MYIPRAVEDTIRKISKTTPVLLVTGARQVGKTTLLSKLAEPNRDYVTLDDPRARYMAKTDPAMFAQRYRPPIIIDEIQYAPEILPYIKMSVDKSQERGGYWLTASQTFHVMKYVSEYLAGRVGILKLAGFSQSELAGIPSEPFTTDSERLLARMKIAKKMELPEIYERIWRGSMPVLYSENPRGLPELYGDFVNTYLARDIRDLSQVGEELTFLDFLKVVAARTAKPLVYEEIAREVQISAPTAKKWMSVLVSSGVVALVRPYHNDVLKRMVKMPLLHFLDTGLAAYLLGWESPEVLARGAMSGPFFETFVFSEIYKSFINAGQQPPLYYYRDRDQKEIGLLIYKNGTLYPIEIKKSATPSAQTVKNFSLLKPVTEPERFGELERLKIDIGPGSVICLIDDLLPVDRQNWFVPAWLI
ncbi:MAG: ATP-binding protein [Deltaproteobacteria bacterium]|jgi:predicted AAA+ superfamily ATPase|nr:ATP-binding protein [Deltaproteobacteria bacterium]